MIEKYFWKSVALAAAVSIANVGPSFADVSFEGPITTSQNFEENVSVTIPEGASAGTHAVDMNGQSKTFTMKDGTTLTIVYEKPNLPTYPSQSNYIGIKASYGGQVEVDKVDMDIAYGGAVYVAGNTGAPSKVVIGDDSVINVREGFGVLANGPSSELHIGDNLELTVNNAPGGTSAVDASWGASITVGDNANIALVDGAYGSQGVWSWAGSQISIGDNVTITTTGERDNYGVRAGSWTAPQQPGYVTIGENATIATESDYSYGLYSDYSGSEILIGDGGDISTKGKGAYGVYARTGGKVTMLGDQTIKVNLEENAYALVADYGHYGDGTTLSTITGDGRMDITGGIYSGTSSDVTLNFQDGSEFYGHTELGDDGKIDLSMTGTQWTLTGDSELTALTVKGDGVVVDFTESEGETVLKMDNLRQEGENGAVFVMKTDVANETGDKLIVDGTSEGDHKIAVKNQGSTATTGKESVSLVMTADDGANFSLTSDVIEIGAWQYVLNQNAYQGGYVWALQGLNKPSGPAASAVSTFAGSYFMSYAETQTLMQRLGDLRDLPGSSGWWFKGYGGKIESDREGFVGSFDMNYWGTQIGYDHEVGKTQNGSTYLGAYFSYGKGDLDYKGYGSGDTEAKTLGLYATYMGRSGFYADFVVKYAWMSNGFDAVDSQGDKVTAEDVDTHGFGASVEIGKRIHLNKSGIKTGWYVEPQMQFGYAHQTGGTFKASNGLEIGVSSYDSLLGRAGFLFGYENKSTNFYLKGFAVKEFDGDYTVTANGVQVQESFDDNWWVYGFGVTSKLNDANSIFLDFQRSSGGSFTEAWAVRAGWRISF